MRTNRSSVYTDSGLTNESPRSFARLIFTKANGDLQKMTKILTKGQSEIWSRFSKKKPTISFLDCCRQRQFCLNYFCRRNQWSSGYARFIWKESWRTYASIWKTSSPRHKQSLLRYKIHNSKCYFVQLLLLRLEVCTVKCCTVPEWIISTNPLYIIWFGIYKILDFGAPISSKFLTTLSIKLLRSFNFSVFFANVPTVGLWDLYSGAHKNPNSQKFVQLSSTPKCFLCSFLPSRWTKWEPLRLSINLNSRFLDNDSTCIIIPLDNYRVQGKT